LPASHSIRVSRIRLIFVIAPERGSRKLRGHL
jgi:hypothetical protein